MVQYGYLSPRSRWSRSGWRTRGQETPHSCTGCTPLPATPHSPLSWSTSWGPHLVLEGEHAGGAGQGGAAVGDPGDRDPGVQPEGV